MNQSRFLAAVASLFLIANSACAEDSPLPQEIAPTDPNIRYVGRFDTSQKDGPRCTWPASSVWVKFHGTALNVKLKEGGDEFYAVSVDGKDATKIPVHKGEGLYTVATGLSDGDHTVQILKCDESFAGVTQFEGFQLEKDAKLLQIASPKYKLEVIGDSISCGYGNEGKSEKEHFTNATENAYETYGAVAARAFGADYVCIAWSGRKMAPDNTMPEIYDRTLGGDAKIKWDMTKWTPDAIVINLATNDFGKKAPDQKEWTQAYEAFLGRLRKLYPNAAIYLATGTMMYGKNLALLKEYLAQIIEDQKKAGDSNIREIDFGTQDPKNGLGSDWHPSVKTHGLMAEKLIKTLQTDLSWVPAADAAKAK